MPDIADPAAEAASPASLLASFQASSPTVYKQLLEFVTYIVQHQPADAFQQIESITAQLASQSPAPAPAPLSSIVDSEEARLSVLAKLDALVNKPHAVTKSEDDEETSDEPVEEEPEISAMLPDIASVLSLFGECGLSLAADEIVTLDRALVHFLTHTEGVDTLRFWGKVLTITNTDYYVVECKRSDYSAEEERERAAREKELVETGVDSGARSEVYGSGANEHQYYVCQDIHSLTPVWTPLPSVTPAMIQAARGSKRFFTGKLSAPVGGFPKFPGDESCYLRTQIARISHATTVAPAGSWKEEEGEVFIENDEWHGVDVGAAVSWIHIRGHLRSEGRVEPFVEEEEEEEADEDSEKKASEPVEPKIPLLQSTSADSVKAIGGSGWSYRTNLAVDTGFKPLAPPADNDEESVVPVPQSQLVSSAHSIVWPGAITAVRGKAYHSIYIGWGLKKDRNTPYRPPPPPAFQSEYSSASLMEGVEVAATAEELAKEAEEDAERKREEGDKPAEAEDDDLPDEEEDKPEED